LTSRFQFSSLYRSTKVQLSLLHEVQKLLTDAALGGSHGGQEPIALPLPALFLLTKFLQRPITLAQECLQSPDLDQQVLTNLGCELHVECAVLSISLTAG